MFCGVFSFGIFFPGPSWKPALGLSPWPRRGAGQLLSWRGALDHGKAQKECASLPPGFMENTWKIQCNLESGYLESKLIRLIKGGVPNFRAAGVGSQ